MRTAQSARAGAIIQVLQTPVLQIGTREVVSISPNANVEEAARIMKEKSVSALPVVEGERIVGILTERDFFKLVSVRTSDRL